jgi:two-component system, OmpR family, sensor kinase
MFRSIRWTLQMWHAAILASVLIVFGWVVLYLMRVTTYQQIDSGLDRMADLVAAGFMRPRRPFSRPDAPRADSARPEPGAARDATAAQGPNDKSPVEKGTTPEPATENLSSVASTAATSAPKTTTAAPPTPPSGPQTAQSDNSGPTGSPGRRGPRFELNEDFPKLFDEEVKTPAYFVVWRSDGSVVTKSPGAVDVPLPEFHPSPHEAVVRQVRQRGLYREMIHQPRQADSRGRPTLYILVGRSIEADLAELHGRGWLLGGAGLAVLSLGLVGGFWFSGRAIKPIEAISAAAAEISLTNLSRRIDVSGTETELTGLARTLNQMIDRLESAFSQQVRFTADASHELRTPLAVILSHAELALDKARPANELRETIETCRRSALRMKVVVESLLTLARFDSGELRIEGRPIDLSRIAGDCAALLRPLAEKRQINIDLDLESAGLVADSDRVTQVVTNLLTNAIRYNRDGGHVVVKTRSDKSEVILDISDTGIGIGPDHLPHIFERFYRVDKARSRKDGGIGLGLAICKSIIEAHGGQITVTSTLDVGTQFEVRLPKRGGPIADMLRDSAERRLDVLAVTVKD